MVMLLLSLKEILSARYDMLVFEPSSHILGHVIESYGSQNSLNSVVELEGVISITELT